MNRSDHCFPKQPSVWQRTGKQILAVRQAVAAGLRLGLMKPETIYHLGQRYYEACPIYQSEAYNRTGLHAWELRAVQTHFSKCSRCLVAAAGGGREVIALRKQGYEADGFECHPSFVELANRLLAADGFATCVRLAPPDECKTSSGNYDALIVGLGAYMHIQTREKRIAFLRQLRALAPAGAPLLLSFWLRPPGARRYNVTVMVGNLFRCLLSRPRLEAGDNFTTYFVHHFTPEEIAGELTNAGYDLVAFNLDEHPHAIAMVRRNPDS